MKIIHLSPRRNGAGAALITAAICLCTVGLFFSRPAHLRAQAPQIVYSEQEKPIANQIHGLRGLPDDVRAGTTKNLAIEIRNLPVTPNKLVLANDLANLSTEGDFGRDTLQEVATTLAAALHEHPRPASRGQIPQPYVELAQLARYEHVEVS